MSADDADEANERQDDPADDEENQRLVGRVIAAKYRVDAYVGGGAMGKVYRATQMLLDRVVAIKVLHAAFSADTTFQSRFHREAKAASRLDHPNSLKVMDFGIEPDGLMYIVMEYLDGGDLHKLITRSPRMSPPRIVELMSQVLSALATAHEAGIVHRDLKPENIMIVQRPGDDGGPVDQVKVADFGIAKIADSSRAGSGEKLTTQGMISGTPEYMSPEQAMARELDGRSDLYACGVILYQMATGRLPFTAESAIAVVLKQVSEPLVPPSHVYPMIDPKLEQVILTALEKDRERRFANAREMRTALRGVIGETTISRAGAVSATMLAIDSVVPPSGSRSVAGVPLPPTPTATPLPAVSPVPLVPAISPPARRSGPFFALLGVVAVGGALGGVFLFRARSALVSSELRSASHVGSPTPTTPVAAPTPEAPPLVAPSAVAMPTPVVAADPLVANPAQPMPGAPPGHHNMGRAPMSAHAPAPVVPVAATPVAPVPTPPPVAAVIAAPAPTAPTPAPVVAPVPPPAPVIAALRDVQAGDPHVTATNGVTALPLQSRASHAASALAQCALREGRNHNDFTSLVTAHYTLDVRDRRLDGLHVRGAPSWISACDGVVRSQFGGELPNGEDTEYTITIDVPLTPNR